MFNIDCVAAPESPRRPQLLCVFAESVPLQPGGRQGSATFDTIETEISDLATEVVGELRSDPHA